MAISPVRKQLGVRVVRFKDFCQEEVDATGTTNPAYWYWTENTAGPTHYVISGDAPAVDYRSVGNTYRVDPYGASGLNVSTLYLMKTYNSYAKWIDLDQSGRDVSPTVSYDVMMQINTSTATAWFVFQWYNTGGTADYAYALRLDSTGVELLKCYGNDITNVSNWSSVGTPMVQPIISTGTDYWFRIVYCPSSFDYGEETYDESGKFIIYMDTEHHYQGLGKTLEWTVTDSTNPLALGDTLGYGVVGNATGAGNHAEFNGITLADDFIREAGMPVLVNKSISEKQPSYMVFCPRVPEGQFCPVSVGDRVEIWISGEDLSGNVMRVLDFDGKVQIVNSGGMEGRTRVYAEDEIMSLGDVYRLQSMDGTETVYQYIEDHVVPPGTTDRYNLRGGGERYNIYGYDSSVLNATSSAGWGAGLDMSDRDYMLFWGWVCNAIQFWTPEGIHFYGKYTPCGGDIDNTDSTTPHRIADMNMIDDGMVYFNKIIVTDDSGTTTSSDSTAIQNSGESTKRELWPMVPQADCNTFASNMLSCMKDEHVYYRVGYFNQQPHFQPGCDVDVVLDTFDPDSATTAIPMMVVQKTYYEGDWGKLNVMGLSSVVYYSLAYFETTGSRRPNIHYSDNEYNDYIRRQLFSERRTEY